MMVANSPVKRGGGRAIDWSRDRSEDTEVSAETCPSVAGLDCLHTGSLGFEFSSGWSSE